MAGLLGRAHLWYCRQCRPGTSALTITGPTAFANGVNLELLMLGIFVQGPIFSIGMSCLHNNQVLTWRASTSDLTEGSKLCLSHLWAKSEWLGSTSRLRAGRIYS